MTVHEGSCLSCWVGSGRVKVECSFLSLLLMTAQKRGGAAGSSRGTSDRRGFEPRSVPISLAQVPARLLLTLQKQSWERAAQAALVLVSPLLSTFVF